MKPVQQKDTPFKIAHTEPSAGILLTERLSECLSVMAQGREIVVVCIGTDRSTGDALGPLAGTHLSKYRSPNFRLFGTLEEPVHAMNLEERLRDISRSTHNPFIIGVDACLGQVSSVGSIQLGIGPVRPGAGVNKELPPVGDIHITGIVNVGGFMEYFVLQNTRLHLVMRMSDIIAQSIFLAARSHTHSMPILSTAQPD